MKKIFVHGSGHRADSWEKTISQMKKKEDIECPELSSLLNGKKASYSNLYAAFADYCSQMNGPIQLCGISLGGILALDYALDFPEKVKTLVLIGTPHKIPKVLFGIQNLVFRLLPESVFRTMAFGKKDTFILGNSMKNLDFRHRMEQLQCPVLILCGEKDRANRKSAYYFRKHMKNAKLHIIRKTGHVVNEEDPEKLAEILNQYYHE